MRRLTLVSYAINGRGMGHLSRQLAILRQVRRLCAVLEVEAECWVLTSSEADTLARREGVLSLKMPSKAMFRDAGLSPHRYLGVARTWVLQAITGLKPDILVVDTFPGGSFGELALALELAPHRVLVAREVKEAVAADPAYQALLPLYERVLTPEEGGAPVLLRGREDLLPRAEARRALGLPEGARAVYLTLGGGGDPAAAQLLPGLVGRLQQAGWHVVVGAGPLYQGEELRGEGLTWLSRYTPAELLSGVDAAVSAGGYNTFHELMHCGVPTVFLPQPRISDDQRARVRRAVEAGAGRLARSADEVVALLEDPGSAEAARALAPENGALAMAREVLATVLDPGQLAAAAGLLTPELLGLLRRQGSEDLQGAMALVRLLEESPAARARQEAALGELRAAGLSVPDLPGREAAGSRVGHFVALCEETRAPLDTGLALLRGLRRKFPAAGGAELLAGAEVLFRAWAPFEDWMGAVSLLRALPTQRELTLARFAALLSEWLASQEDLFDAVRDFSRLEGRGARPVGEVLALLRTGEAP